MKKIFNLLVQVSIEDTGRENIIKHLDNISNNINNCCKTEPESKVYGETIVDGYWESEEDYMTGADCKDDDNWEE